MHNMTRYIILYHRTQKLSKHEMQNMHLRKKNPGNYIYIKVFNNMSKLLLIACNFDPFVYEVSC